MVKKYKAKEMVIMVFLTLSALAISSSASGVSFLAKEIVNLGMGEKSSWREAILLSLVFAGSLIGFLVFKYVGQQKIIKYKKELNSGIFRGLLQKRDFNALRGKQGEAVTMIVDDTNQVCNFIENTLPPILETFIVSLLMGAMTFFVNKLIFVVVLMLSFISALAVFFSRYLDVLERENYKKKDAINQEIVDVFKFIGVASSIRNAQIILKKLNELIILQNGTEYKKRRLAITFDVISRMCSVGREVFVILYGMRRARFDVGTVVAMLNITSFFNELVNISGDLAIKFAQVKFPLERINAVLAENDNEDEREPAQDLNSINEIWVRNLTYLYDKKNGISDVSFQALKGCINVIKGEIGSGKSTVGKIISGVLTGYQGEILADDKLLNSEGLRKNVAYVDQEAVISIGSIEENITAYDENIDREKLYRVIEKCGLKEWIDSLTQGLGTPLYSEEINLSGGQKQRLAIARAMYKDAPIIVLDEPTSSLDKENATVIWSLLNDQKETKILLVITHDSRILQERAAQIHQITMQDGKVVYNELAG